MKIETAQDIFSSIEKTALDDLKIRLFKSALTYAQIRAEWFLGDTEKRKAMDELRTRAHNAFIDYCNILSRNMLKAGEDNSWRDILVDNRKEIGDFACYIHCFLAISAR